MKRRDLLLGLGSTALAGCSGMLPQQQLTYTAPLTAAEEAALLENPRNLSQEEFQRLMEENQRRVRESVNFFEFKVSSTAAIAGFGYTGGARTGYAVFRDGNAALFPNGRAMVELERIAPRLDSTQLAGNSNRIVLGRTPRGTFMSWNPDNLSRQVVLRPQQSTFGQVWSYDSTALRGSSHLLIATENSSLETWSLTSGNRVRRTEITDTQPRVLARGSRSDYVIFGTNEGQVRLWTGGRNSRILYAHSGPVLKIQILRSGRVLSAGKDGVLKSWASESDEAVTLAQFSSALYEFEVSADEKYILPYPSGSNANIINLESRESLSMTPFGFGPTRQAIIDSVRSVAFTLHNRGLVSMRSMGRNRLLPVEIELPIGHQALHITYSYSRGQLLISTAGGHLYAFDVNQGALSLPMLRTETPIARIAISSAGDQMMVALSDNRVLSFDLGVHLETALDVTSND